MNWRAIAQLVRLPNLPTALADIALAALAVAALARPEALAAVPAAAARQRLPVHGRHGLQRLLRRRAGPPRTARAAHPRRRWSHARQALRLGRRR